MVIVTTGAKRNVGDHLIHQSGRRLLEQHVTGRLVSHPRWTPLDRYSLEQAKGVIALGGPGIGPQLLDKFVPLKQGLEHGIPCFVLGMGSHQDAIPSLGESTLGALERVNKINGLIGLRDPLTQEIISRESSAMTEMVGCVAWFRTEFLTSDPLPPEGIRHLVFTTPASINQLPQCQEVLQSLALLFPDAKKSLVFHAGYPHVQDAFALSDQGNSLSPRDRAWRLRDFARWFHFRSEAKRIGWKIVDASGDLRRIGFYEMADLHVGYRVHAHIDFLARRKPSLLIAEDIRGLGQFEALQDPYRLDFSSEPHTVLESVEREIDAFEASFQGVAAMRRTWPKMEAFLRSIGERTR